MKLASLLKLAGLIPGLFFLSLQVHAAEPLKFGVLLTLAMGSEADYNSQRCIQRCAHQ